MTQAKPRLVGLNRIALEVGDIQEALHFYGIIFSFYLRGSHKDGTGRVVMAFIDIGDQFIALSRGRHQKPDRDRHFGLVMDDRSHARELAVTAGAKRLDGDLLDFLDPWGNRIEVVEYADLQFTKSPGVLRAMGLHLPKTEKAQLELHERDWASLIPARS